MITQTPLRPRQYFWFVFAIIVLMTLCISGYHSSTMVEWTEFYASDDEVAPFSWSEAFDILSNTMWFFVAMLFWHKTFTSEYAVDRESYPGQIRAVQKLALACMFMGFASGAYDVMLSYGALFWLRMATMMLLSLIFLDSLFEMKLLTTEDVQVKIWVFPALFGLSLLPSVLANRLDLYIGCLLLVVLGLPLLHVHLQPQRRKIVLPMALFFTAGGLFDTFNHNVLTWTNGVISGHTIGNVLTALSIGWYGLSMLKPKGLLKK